MGQAWDTSASQKVGEKSDSAQALLLLSDDVLLHMTYFLDNISLFNMTRANSNYYKIFSSDVIWKERCEAFGIAKYRPENCSHFEHFLLVQNEPVQVQISNV